MFKYVTYPLTQGAAAAAAALIRVVGGSSAR